MIFALIKDGVVVNTILADSAFVQAHYSDYTAVELPTAPGGPGVGWKYNGSQFASPDPVVVTPPEETRDQKQDRILSELVAELAAAQDNVQTIADAVGVVIVDPTPGPTP